MVYMICKLPSGFLSLKRSKINSRYAEKNVALGLSKGEALTKIIGTVSFLSEAKPDQRI